MYFPSQHTRAMQNTCESCSAVKSAAVRACPQPPLSMAANGRTRNDRAKKGSALATGWCMAPRPPHCCKMPHSQIWWPFSAIFTHWVDLIGCTQSLPKSKERNETNMANHCWQSELGLVKTLASITNSLSNWCQCQPKALEERKREDHEGCVFPHRRCVQAWTSYEYCHSYTVYLGHNLYMR